jgi:5-methyltetrahydropteroyltriglutamate--homocysteine methyltransferase
MTARNNPPFRADHVGSLLRPPALHEAREKHKKGEITQAELKAVEDASIREAVQLQKDVGLRAFTDGEYRRASWSGDFLKEIGNVESEQSKLTVRFHSVEGEYAATPPGFRVAGKLFLPHGIFVDAFEYVKTLAGSDGLPKLTIPSPTLLHFRGGRESIDKAAYPTMEAFYADLAGVYTEELRQVYAAGCRYLQVDETNFAYLCDPALREQVRANVHEDPDQLPHTYAKLFNGFLKGRPADMTVCMHVCRGNSSSMWVAEGGYEPVAETLFNEIDIDGYFLEYDTPRAGDFSPLRFVPKGKKIIVLGLVSSKFPELESKDELKRRIDEAAKYVPLEQLALSPQCGFASTERGNKLTFDDQRRKLERVVEVAQEVWGGV